MVKLSSIFYRRDTRNVKIPSFAETFPSKFLDSQVFSQAREMAAVVPQNIPVCIILLAFTITAIVTLLVCPRA